MEQLKRSCWEKSLHNLLGNVISAIRYYSSIAIHSGRNLFSDLPNIDEETVDVDRIVEMINEKIARFDQKVTKYEYGLNKKDFYVFHTTAATSMSKMQNSYKENELDFFKALLANITESEDLKITPRDALNLSSRLPEKINKLRAQNLLDIWIENHYFYKHTDSNIYLGAKTLTEFKEHLQQKELNNLRSCILCECIAIWVRNLHNVRSKCIINYFYFNRDRVVMNVK